jgi:hypothetical protein
MKKRTSSVIVLNTVFTMLVLAGCDDAVHDDGNWLADESNPLIGTWTTAVTNMMGVTTTTKREFKNDGTIAVTTKQGDNPETSSSAYYLVKDDILVVSQTTDPHYIKYRFSVIDNNNLKIVRDGTGNVTYYMREGAENPGANRTTELSWGISGYYRAGNSSAATMYDWYDFKKDGTYRVYHWMNDNPHYIDRGEFSYYIDDASNFVSITGQYTVRLFTGFTQDTTTIKWDDGSERTFYEFDGKNFAIP